VGVDEGQAFGGVVADHGHRFYANPLWGNGGHKEQVVGGPEWYLGAGVEGTKVLKGVVKSGYGISHAEGLGYGLGIKVWKGAHRS
jgi:hypothetical protein